VPRLSILIATVGERDKRFRKLVGELTPQVRAYPGQIEVLCYWNNGELPIAEIRQALVNEARGEYVCFIDDDDGVPSYYCDRIMQATESYPDQVGWVQQLYWDGVKTKPTFHSIKYDGWSEDVNGYYRECSHLNPIKREIALKIPFTGYDGPEDLNWAQRVASFVDTEEYVDDVMYLYYYNSADSIWQTGKVPDKNYMRPTLPEYFRYHPESKSVFIKGE
jgi:hypothetical protein